MPAQQDSSDNTAIMMSSSSSTIQLGLGRITSLLHHLGSPHLAIPIVHIAGTNGKGSVCAYLDSILRCSGLAVGRFTSPHLIEPRDCISVQGRIIDKQTFDWAQNKVLKANDEHDVGASSFELLTAAAFESFRATRPPLDVAVVEVGLGGATDATNVCPKPLATVITAVDLDHQSILGNTVAEIARVKAGIIKKGVPCILAPQAHKEAKQAVTQVAAEMEAPLRDVEIQDGGGFASWRDEAYRAAVINFEGKPIAVTLPLPGSYQLGNAAAAVLTAQMLKDASPSDIGRGITAQSVTQGIESTTWPGRLSWVTLPEHVDRKRRQILVDGAHNQASLDALVSYLNSLDNRETTFIVAMSQPRSARTLVETLSRVTCDGKKVLATTFTPPEGMAWVKPVEADGIVAAAREADIQAVSTMSIEDALNQADLDTRLVICGSLYLVSDLYRLLGLPS